MNDEPQSNRPPNYPCTTIWICLLIGIVSAAFLVWRSCAKKEPGIELMGGPSTGTGNVGTLIPVRDDGIGIDQTATSNHYYEMAQQVLHKKTNALASALYGKEPVVELTNFGTYTPPPHDYLFSVSNGNWIYTRSYGATTIIVRVPDTQWQAIASCHWLSNYVMKTNLEIYSDGMMWRGEY